MARSFKKNPILKDNGNGKKWQKNQANKAIRHIKDDEEGSSVANGGAYKKHYESWNITDFACRQTKEDAIDYYNKRCTPEFYSGKWSSKEICENLVNDFKKKYPTLEVYLNCWKKTMLRK